ncbi:MAG: nucleoside transporter C-terminal domain-containing protein [bacterium]
MFNWIKSYLVQDDHYLTILSILFIFLIAFIFSNNKKRINYKSMINALIIQFLFAVFILKTNIGYSTFKYLAKGFVKVYSFANKGLEFVFGGLVNEAGPWGYIFAVKVVAAIVFFGALMSLLHHLKVIQFFVKIISFLIRPLLKTSGAETLCAVGNSMLGPTEAPLLVKNYLKGMTESEIFLVMVAGMSTLNASLIAIYGAIGIPEIHLLAASVISIPGSILIAKILVPETGIPQTSTGMKMDGTRTTANILDAISVGTTDGLSLALNIGAMLISFISLIAMVDFLLVKATSFGLFTNPYTLDMVFAKVFSPITYLIGVSKTDSAVAGTLLGQKIVLNEFIAYINFLAENISQRTQVIMTYALCGMSNFSVIGILIGGVGALCPEQRPLLTRLGLKALLGGTLVNLLNAAIAALLI